MRTGRACGLAAETGSERVAIQGGSESVGPAEALPAAWAASGVACLVIGDGRAAGSTLAASAVSSGLAGNDASFDAARAVHASGSEAPSSAAHASNDLTAKRDSSNGSSAKEGTAGGSAGAASRIGAAACGTSGLGTGAFEAGGGAASVLATAALGTPRFERSSFETASRRDSARANASCDDGVVPDVFVRDGDRAVRRLLSIDRPSIDHSSIGQASMAMNSASHRFPVRRSRCRRRAWSVSRPGCRLARRVAPGIARLIGLAIHPRHRGFEQGAALRRRRCRRTLDRRHAQRVSDVAFEFGHRHALGFERGGDRHRRERVVRRRQRRVAVPAGVRVQTVGAAALRTGPKVGVGVGALGVGSHD